MAPSHVTAKWVREIGETLPDTFAMVVRSITDLDRLYSMYQAGDKSVYAVFSKEKARDGYMRYPVVRYDRRARGFRCPDCGEVVQMLVSDDGTKYLTNADQFYFQREHRGNHTCENCGSPLWSAVNPGREIPWAKIGGYGWVYRDKAAQHMGKTKNEKLLTQLSEIAAHPKGYWPVKGACRRYPLSTYIKKKYRGRIDGFLCDELHEYNNASGQGDAMAELFGVAKQFVGMTATLINGYSSGIFHLLYRLVPGLMGQDGKSYRRPSDFDAEYGVIENTYELQESDYNSNRRTTKRKTKSKKLPGVSPLEDIAAAFKKMAVINPERRAAQIEVRPAAEITAPEIPAIKTESARIQRKAYDGLLERTLEEQKKKKSKKLVVDEGQFSITGFAA